LGAEIIAYSFGAALEYLDKEEKGLKNIEVLVTDNLFAGITSFNVYESYKWAITKLSVELEGLARSGNGFEVIKHKTRPIYGFQFHPEMFEDKSCGDEVFHNLILILTGE
jgi:GMP synthase (glutamine-hydrolysing)